MKLARGILIAICALVGVNGLFGGFAAISRPDGPFGIPTSALKNGPFTSFLVPGICLFVVLGLGNLATGYVLLRKLRFYEYFVGAMGVASLGWIVAQVYVMQEVNGLHVFIACMGLAQAGFAVFLLVRENKFPFSLV